MARFTLDSGICRGSDREKAFNTGEMDQSMKVISATVKKKDSVYMSGQIDLNIVGIGMRIILKEKVNINGQMGGGIKVNGRKICYMALVYTNGQMVENMKDNTKTIRSMDMVCINGQMVRYTMVIGKMENNTVKQHLRTPKERVELVCGKMAIESNGFQERTV